MKKLLYLVLKIIAKKIIRHHHPFIIAVTGSVGKTSAKEAIFAILKNHFRIRKNEKNYNNEIGIPLTLIGSESGGRSLIKWFKIFLKGIKVIYQQEDFPEMFVLEYGADKPGDVDYLLNIAPGDIGVLTAVAAVHLEFFGSLENVFSEKSKIITRLTNAHAAVLNGDDLKIRNLKNQTKARVYTYGLTENNDLQATEVKISQKDKQVGMSFKLHFQGKVIPLFLPQIIGKPQVSACLAALAVANILHLNILEAIDELKLYQPPPGRTKLITGIKNSLLIDDSYNASPASTKAALEILAELPILQNSKRIAVLGEMLELGSYTEEGHQQVGNKAAAVGVDLLVTVGEKARDIIRGAITAGLAEEKTVHFDNNHDAGIFVQQKIHPGDLVLIKGSQGARMEQIVKELMAEPEKAGELLVRQGEEWRNR